MLYTTQYESMAYILKEKKKHVPTRSPAHSPASSPPVPALTAKEEKHNFLESE
jgi:hypothetical protein